MQPLEHGYYDTMPLRGANDVYDINKHRKKAYRPYTTQVKAQYTGPSTGSTIDQIETKDRWHYPEQGQVGNRLFEWMYKAVPIPTAVHPSVRSVHSRQHLQKAKPPVPLRHPRPNTYVQVFINEPFRTLVPYSFSHNTTPF